MQGEFIVLENGTQKIYTNVDDIPERFENLIKFNPDFPKPPHTHVEHIMMDQMGIVFKELLQRETK